MTVFVWSKNSKLKSITLKSCFAPFWLLPASATKSFVVDLLFRFRRLQVAGVRLARPHLGLGGLRLLEGAFLRERRCWGAAGAFGVSVVAVHGDSSSTRASTPRGCVSTRTAARRCCWNVEAQAFVESFDVNGGAVVLLVRRLSPAGCLRHCQPPLGLQLSDGVLRRERRREGAAGASASGSLRTRTQRF